MQGVSNETAGSITLFAATYLNIPVSTTNTITGAIIRVERRAGCRHRMSATLLCMPPVTASTRKSCSSISMELTPSVERAGYTTATLQRITRLPAQRRLPCAQTGNCQFGAPPEGKMTITALGHPFRARRRRLSQARLARSGSRSGSMCRTGFATSAPICPSASASRRRKYVTRCCSSQPGQYVLRPERVSDTGGLEGRLGHGVAQSEFNLHDRISSKGR